MKLGKQIVTGLAIVLIVLACTPNDQSQQQAQNLSDTHNAYVMKNDVEFKNYNKREIISDDPTTILWCTAAFPIPGSPLFTIPIVGKLTSSNKRPYPDSTGQPGPDGMFGSSSEYRYGFTPAGVYVDFTGLSTFCSTEPTIWQTQSTKIIMGVDNTLQAAEAKAQQQLAAGDTAGANKTLQDAINAAGGN